MERDLFQNFSYCWLANGQDLMSCGGVQDPNPEHKDPDVEPTLNVQGAQRVVSVTLTPVFVQSASVMTVLFPVMNHV